MHNFINPQHLKNFIMDNDIEEKTTLIFFIIFVHVKYLLLDITKDCVHDKYSENIIIVSDFKTIF